MARTSDLYRSVMVCSRLDDADSTTVETAHRWARRLGAPLVVCHVVTPLFGALVSIAETKRVVSEYLQRHIGAEARDVHIVIASGDPEVGIVQVASRVRPQLVVLGPSEEWTLWPSSHVTERLTERLDCSVLVARHGDPTGSVVAGIDVDAEDAPHLLALAAQTAARNTSSLVAVNVLDDCTVLDRLRRVVWSRASEAQDNATRAEMYVRREALRLLTAGHHHGIVRVLEGTVVESMLHATDETEASLLVMGDGPIARRLARKATCSVLVARGELTAHASRNLSSMRPTAA